ncbi:hypothetical protein [uncultured Adlercreutzia sp.]|uniref:hypothetical protein n=1 Tax=uncultured Adlercreutzia sp. TaxID=875803 RepID=UPI0025FF4251|nr:hypothetical protein [uncultured Adlercreutzia sp.]
MDSGVVDVDRAFGNQSIFWNNLFVVYVGVFYAVIDHELGAHAAMYTCGIASLNRGYDIIRTIRQGNVEFRDWLDGYASFVAVPFNVNRNVGVDGEIGKDQVCLCAWGNPDSCVDGFLRGKR